MRKQTRRTGTVWRRAAIAASAFFQVSTHSLSTVLHPTPSAKNAVGNGARLGSCTREDARAYISRVGKSRLAARSDSRPLFGKDVVNLLHDPFCPLNRSRDHGGGSRTLPGVEEIVGGSRVTSYEDFCHDRRDSVPCRA
jgi:hypothetical protein